MGNHQSRSHKQREQRGMTLIETGIVVAVVAVIASSAAPSFQGFIERQRLEGASAQLAGDIQFARAESVFRNTGLRLSLHSHEWGSCYVVHTGAAGDCNCTASGPALCEGDAQQIKTVQLPSAEHIALTANVSSIMFDPLHGTSSPTATLQLATMSGRSLREVVNLMGRVRTCSPQGSMPGHAVC